LLPGTCLWAKFFEIAFNCFFVGIKGNALLLQPIPIEFLIDIAASKRDAIHLVADANRETILGGNMRRHF
jgi:hypothetical protein